MAGDIIVKGGAEGMLAVAVRSRGLGIALKVKDGTRRAAGVVMANLLLDLVDLNSEQTDVLRRYADPVIKNVAGKPVGRLHHHLR